CRRGSRQRQDGRQQTQRERNRKQGGAPRRAEPSDKRAGAAAHDEQQREFRDPADQADAPGSQSGIRSVQPIRVKARPGPLNSRSSPSTLSGRSPKATAASATAASVEAGP